MTGHEIWLRSGLVTPAIRASYALPGVFKPVRHDGKWLIDGAVVNPIPVSACRAMGSRLVIAVNLIADSIQIIHRAFGLIGRWFVPLISLDPKTVVNTLVYQTYHGNQVL